MIFSFRPTHLLLAAACVCLALAISPFAHSQAAPPAQQGQEAQPAPQTPNSSSAQFKEDWGGQVNEYYGDLHLDADECKEFQRHIEEGMKPEKESLWIKYIGSMRLREDETQEMCTIFIDADTRTKELERQFYAVYGGKLKLYYLETHGPVPHNVGAKQIAMYHQQLSVVEETIAKLRQELGEDGFRKLDISLYYSYYVGRTNLKYPETPSPAKLTALRQPEPNSAPVVVPWMQPSTLDSAPLIEDWGGQVHFYYDYIPFVADKCREFQQHIEEGKEPDKEPLWTLYIIHLRLREDEAQKMCAIFIDAYSRTSEFQRQFLADDKGEFGLSLRLSQSAELNAKRAAMYQHKLMVTVEAITKLKQEFGEEDFKKLDGHFYQQNHVGAPYPASVSGSNQPKANPAPASAPKVQP